MAAITPLESWRQGDQKFKVILRHVLKVRSAWATWGPILGGRKKANIDTGLDTWFPRGVRRHRHRWKGKAMVRGLAILSSAPSSPKYSCRFGRESHSFCAGWTTERNLIFEDQKTLTTHALISKSQALRTRKTQLIPNPCTPSSEDSESCYSNTFSLCAFSFFFFLYSSQDFYFIM